ncbi:fatty acyl-CoA reductase 1 isoform X2 [Cephus cinctus]|uniref:Fatty acyl-CoA reductase n=1 Tax=Cephus cinctus TaxID=211228 RepID=A0AAJ7FDR1_CEPCN|nr:fatty acyl-CoA reductase 1 isoform X2 [Cephus cinctus]
MVKVEKSWTLSVPAFYAGKSILITGASGFMGKVLIEKLLRSCPDIREIFLLMRPKKGTSIDGRLRTLLTLPLFDKLREERPSSFEKLIPVNGDVIEEGLGLAPTERRVLAERVSIIFHVAASVRFDDTLKDAVIVNARATRDVCILATNMKQLLAFVHVSSTYSQADKPEVKEIVYPAEVDWKQTIKIAENVDDHTLRILTPKFLGTSPNTYTFSKRLAEQVVTEYSEVLPVVIFRPSIVISSLAEPVPGWLDNFNGPVGMMVGGGKGILRVLYVDPTLSADFIPVDIAIKGMVCAAWKRGITTVTQDPKTHVYNCASCGIKSITTAEIVEMGLRMTEEIPLEGILWYPNTLTTNSKLLYYILTMILHFFPALILDGFLKMSGRREMLTKLQRKVFTANSALEYFLINQWKFRNEKMLNLLTDLPTEDLDTFGYDYWNFDIVEYFRGCLIGAKVYLLKEDMNKVEEAKAHFKRHEATTIGQEAQ